MSALNVHFVIKSETILQCAVVECHVRVFQHVKAAREYSRHCIKYRARYELICIAQLRETIDAEQPAFVSLPH